MSKAYMETGEGLIGRIRIICSGLVALSLATVIWGSEFFSLVSFGVIFAAALLGWSVKTEVTIGDYLLWVALLLLSLLNLREEIFSLQAFSMSWFTENRYTLLVPTMAGAVTIGMGIRYFFNIASRIYGRWFG